MINKIKAVLQILGVDSVIRNVLIGKIWNILALPVSIYLTVHFLTKEEQGYYYTFASIQALQVFFEMGLTGIIMQFASHEMAGLSWNEKNVLEGTAKCKGRISSLLRFTVIWYSRIAALTAIFLFGIGYWFFSTSTQADVGGVDWQIPWLILAIVTPVNMLIAPLWGIAEGTGKIGEIYLLNLKQTIISTLVLWIMLSCGGKLYSPGIQLVTTVVVGGFYYRKHFGPMIKDLWKYPNPEKSSISWKKEIWPLQWKVSVSWLSGYFIGHLVSPVLFRSCGAEIAGSYGMTVRMIDSIANVSYSWVTTKSAFFGRLIALKEGKNLKKLFMKSIAGALSCYVLLAGVFVCVIWMAQSHELRFNNQSFSQRVLDWKLVAALAFNAGMFCIILSVAILTRAEKKEPFLWPSVISGIGSFVFIPILGKHYGAEGVIFYNMAFSLLFTLPCVFWIYRRFAARNFPLA